MLYFGTRARLFKTEHFHDPEVRRMLSKLQNVDKSALPTEDLREVIDRAPGLQGTHSCTPREGGSCLAWKQSIWGRSGCWWDGTRASSRGGGRVL